MSLEAQSFAKDTGMSLTKIVNAVDIDHPDFKLANITAREIGFESLEQMLLQANSDLLYEFQIESRGGIFAILMRMPRDIPMPDDARIRNTIKKFFEEGGYKIHTLLKKFSGWAEIDTRPWKKLGISRASWYRNKEAILANEYIVRVQKEQTPMKKAIEGLNQWIQENQRRPISNAIDKTEKYYGAIFNKLTSEEKDVYYEKYSLSKPSSKREVITVDILREWILTNKRRPLRGRIGEHELSRAFSSMSDNNKNKIIEEFPEYFPPKIRSEAIHNFRPKTKKPWLELNISRASWYRNKSSASCQTSI